MTSRTIKVDYLARVEGEGAMHIRMSGDRVDQVQLKIFEPPRFFEGLLQGRDFQEAPDITSRICGICPVAYLLGASQAMEMICNATVTPVIKQLRRIIYCGEWIESHALHIFMLHAPDFLGYPDAITMARDDPDLVQKGLRLKKIGNRIIEVVGGREVHPINLKVGGFYRLPDSAVLKTLRPELEWGLDVLDEIIEQLASFHFPDFNPDYTLMALQHKDEYAITEGQMVSNTGLDEPVSGYETLFEQHHQPWSNALHSRLRESGEAVLLGPMARFALNYAQLTPRAKAAAMRIGLDPSCRNPFKSILIRAVELIFCFEEALALISVYQPQGPAAVPITSKAGVGYGATEAPRGICYHRYQIDKEGVIEKAKIVSPTAVNQPRIEEDLFGLVQQYTSLDDETLKWRCEQAIRNYDPCISCSVHFLNLTVERY